MSSLRIIDYRNAKYQGQTNKYMKNGFGMLVDDNFTLIIAAWSKNKLHGPAVVVYPENIIFYGQYQNGLPNGIAAFQLENMISLYCIFNRSNNQNTNQTSFKIDPIIVIVMEKAAILIQAFIDYQNMNQIKILSDSTFQNQQQKFKNIKQILKSQIKQSMKQGWIHYLDSQINEKYPNYLQITKTLRNRNRQIMIGFKKGDTLGGSFTQGIYSQPLSIGYYKKQHIFKDLGRKYIETPNGKIIQEGIYNVTSLNNIKQKNLSNSAVSVNSSNVYTYLKREQQRPLHAIKAIQKYFKQSLSFNNSFVNLAQVYKAQSICFKVQTALLMNTAQKYAQIQLEQTKSKIDSRIKNNLLQKAIKQYQRQKNGIIQEFTIQQIKQQVYQALKKRNKAGAIKSNTSNFSNNLLSSRRNTVQYQSPMKQFQSKQIKKQVIQMKQIKKIKQFKQIKYNSPPKKSVHFIDNINENGISRQKQKSRSKSKSKAYNYSPQLIYSKSRNSKGIINSSQKKQGYNRSPNRYKYIPLQNLDILTKDYEKVQKQIQKQTPKASRKNEYIRNFTYNENKKENNDKLYKSPARNNDRSKSGNKVLTYNYKY